MNGVSSGNLTANAATYTIGATNLFTGAIASINGVFNGVGISGRASASCTSLYNAVGATATITPYLEYKKAPNAGYRKGFIFSILRIA